MKMILWCVPLLVIYEINQCLYLVYVIIKNTVMTCETFSVQAFFVSTSSESSDETALSKSQARLSISCLCRCDKIMTNLL